MNAKEFATEMKAVIVDLKSKGNESIKSDNLIAYLTEVENSHEAEPSPMEMAHYQATLQHSSDLNNFAHEERIEMFKSVITAGQNAIKTSFLLNGGAAIAMLAFIGHLAQFNPEKVSEFGCALYPFTIGVFLISVTSGFTYLSQWFYSGNTKSSKKAGSISNFLCIVMSIASLLCFAWGMLDVKDLFLKFV